MPGTYLDCQPVEERNQVGLEGEVGRGAEVKEGGGWPLGWPLFSASTVATRHPRQGTCCSAPTCPLLRFAAAAPTANTACLPRRNAPLAQRVVFEDPQLQQWIDSLCCLACGGGDDDDQLLLCDGGAVRCGGG